MRRVSTVGNGVRVRLREGEREADPLDHVARGVRRVTRELAIQRRHGERTAQVRAKRERLLRRARGPGRTAFTLAALEALIERGLLDHMADEE